jgi:chromate reductase, NAD(P)H dehydrogenase (quinone)
MKALAFAASSSRNSINKQLVSYALSKLEHTEKTLLDLNDFPLPLYSIDLEKETGIPEALNRFAEQIDTAELILISFAEHNGTYTAVFKNLFDWLSRNKTKCFDNKKMILLSTSPGARGGRGVMDAALTRFPIHGAVILGHFCLPNFMENFDSEKGIINAELQSEFNALLQLSKKS